MRGRSFCGQSSLLLTSLFRRWTFPWVRRSSYFLEKLQSEFRLTCIFISHSLLVVAQVATPIAVMCTGQFVEVGLAEQVLHQPGHAYTRELLGTVPVLPSR